MHYELTGLRRDGMDFCIDNEAPGFPTGTDPNENAEYAGPALFLSMPEDVCCIVASCLSLSDFAKLLRSNKETQTRFDCEFLGKNLLGKMGRATTGFAILEVISKIASVQAAWQAPLALAFSRNVRDVAVRDQSILTAAWIKLFEGLPQCTDAQKELIPYFACSELHRRGGRPGSLANDYDPIYRMASLSAQDLYIVADHLCEGNREADWGYYLRPIVASCDTFPRPSSALARKLATALSSSGLHDVSRCLVERFNVSLDVQHRDIDPWMVQHICNRRGSVNQGCEQWRPGDADFLRRTELQFLEIVGKLDYFSLSPAKVTSSLTRLRFSFDVDATTLAAILKNEGVEDAILRMQKRVQCASDVTEWLLICEEVRSLPWQTWPFFMHHLALRQPFGEEKENAERDSAFVAFCEWRTDIASKCDGPESWRLQARAWASVLQLRYSALRYVPFAPASDGQCLNDPASPAHAKAAREALVESAFAEIPTPFWQPLLEMVLGDDNRANRFWDPKDVHRKIGVFLADPDAMVLAPLPLLAAILRRVFDSGMFLTLPEGAALTADDLCRRFGWRTEEIHKDMLIKAYSIAGRTDHKMEEVLASMKMNSVEAYHDLGMMIWRCNILPALCDGRDGMATVSKYTGLKDSFLFEKARVFAAGTDAVQ